MFTGIMNLLEHPETNLRKIHLVNLNVSLKSWQKLAKGIENSKILKKLKFNRINFEKDQQQLEILIDAIQQNYSIESIDLSCNNLSDTYGSLVAKFIQSQIEMREEYKWRGSLRIGRKPSMDIINHGLKEFIVHHNNLGRNFLKSLSDRLKEDDYLRFLDLRYNKIGLDLVMKFLKRMNTNRYIVGIDMRGNKGYADNETAKEVLSLILQRNVGDNLTSKVVLKKRWVIEE